MQYMYLKCAGTYTAVKKNVCVRACVCVHHVLFQHPDDHKDFLRSI